MEMAMKSILVLALLLSLTSCFKTAEQVRREQRVDNMSQQLSDSQNIVADLTVMLKNLQSQIDILSGKVEELQKNQQQLQGADLKGMTESLNVMKTQLDTVQKSQEAQSEELKLQRGFIEKVTEKLGNLNKSTSAGPKKGPKDEIAEARKLIGRRKLSDARSILEGMINDSKVSPGDMNKVLHGLGEIEFAQKNWEKSLVFFSKIYTKYPKSSLAPSSLLHIGRALKKLGKTDEASQAFQELRTQYPDSAAAKEARQ
jgi:TolA-binding protein